MVTRNRDHLLKILLMGDASAGKASILLNSTIQNAPTAGEHIAVGRRRCVYNLILAVGIDIVISML